MSSIFLVCSKDAGWKFPWKTGGGGFFAKFNLSTFCKNLLKGFPSKAFLTALHLEHFFSSDLLRKIFFLYKCSRKDCTKKDFTSEFFSFVKLFEFFRLQSIFTPSICMWRVFYLWTIFGHKLSDISLNLEVARNKTKLFMVFFPPEKKQTFFLETNKEFFIWRSLLAVLWILTTISYKELIGSWLNEKWKKDKYKTSDFFPEIARVPCFSWNTW